MMGFAKNSLGYCLECGGGAVTGHLNFCSHHGESFSAETREDLYTRISELEDMLLSLKKELDRYKRNCTCIL